MMVWRWIQSAVISMVLVKVMADAETPSASKVIDLNDDSFEHLTQASTGQTTGKWFVEFYAPWCGHCKSLAPVWEDLATKLEITHPEEGIVVAKIDVTANQETSSRFKIRGYPTLKFFAGRKIYTYRGERTVEAFTQYVTGGYLESEPEDVPPMPSVYERQMKKIRNSVKSNKIAKDLVDDFEHIIDLRKNAALLLLLIGAVFGLIVGYIFGTRGGKAKKAKTE